MHPIQKWLKRLMFLGVTFTVVAYSLYLTLNNDTAIDLDLFFYEGASLPLSVVLLSAFVVGAVLGLSIDFASRLKLKNTISVLEKKIAKLEP